MHPDVSFGYECPFVAARDRIPRRLGPLDCAPVGHVGTVRECVSERALARGAAEASGELALVQPAAGLCSGRDDLGLQPARGRGGFWGRLGARSKLR
jgi:hypothetical protein